jgi:hypothetical protein
VADPVAARVELEALARYLGVRPFTPDHRPGPLESVRRRGFGRARLRTAHTARPGYSRLIRRAQTWALSGVR